MSQLLPFGNWGKPGTLQDDRGWNLHVTRLYPLLGLAPRGHLPDEGMAIRIINGVRVWVISKDEAKARGVFHRVRCFCTRCQAEVPASRLFQHKCKEA